MPSLDVRVEPVLIPYRIDVRGGDKFDLHLSCVYAFRPQASGVIDDSELLRDWPAALPFVGVSALFGTSSRTFELTRLSKVSEQDSVLWGALFPGAMRVSPAPTFPAFDETTIATYDAVTLAQSLAQHYVYWAHGSRVSVAVSETAQIGFQTFHQLKAAPVDLEVAEGPPDFLQQVSVYSEYRGLQRRLRLAEDFFVTVDQETLFGVVKDGPIRALISAPWVGRQPWVEYSCRKQAHGKRWLFSTRQQYIPGKKMDVREGFVPLQGVFAHPHMLIDFDLDGGQHRLAEFGAQEANGEEPPKPGLLSAGVSLVRKDRAAALTAFLGSPKSLKGDLYLEAQHVTIGLRPDVRRAGDSKWRSLCRRRAIYVVKVATGAEITFRDDEEGSVSAALTRLATNDPAFKISPAMFCWDGWSLIVPPPWRSPKDPPEVEPEGPFVRLDAQAFGLPKLRFGTLYELRVRTADMANNSLPDELADDLTEEDRTEKVMQFVPRRHDQVPPPLVLDQRGGVPNACCYAAMFRTRRSFGRRGVTSTWQHHESRCISPNNTGCSTRISQTGMTG